MDLKFFLTFGLSAICATPMFAQADDPDGIGGPVVCNVPGTLNYENALEDGSFFYYNEGVQNNASIDASLTYLLNVPKEGNYVLYLNVGDKEKNGNGLGYDIIINDETVYSVADPKNYGGNWNVFVMLPYEITLPAGESTLKILSTSDRWNMNALVPPVILPKDNSKTIKLLGSVNFDVMYPDPESSINFTTYSAFGVDNSGFGSDHSVLVTSQDFSDNGGSKMQSPYSPTQLRYLVNVEQTGSYTVDVTGFFSPEREKNSDTGSFELIADIEGFDLNINAVAIEDESVIVSNSISFPTIDINNPENFVAEFPEVWDGHGGQTIDLSAKGTISLPAGNYWIEISTDYPYADTFNLTALTVSELDMAGEPCDVPGALDYRYATKVGQFLHPNGEAAALESSLTYNLNVDQAGDYLLYLNVGDKEKNGNGLGYDIKVNGETVHNVVDPKNYGGNWNVFVMIPYEITLPAGESTLTILSTSDRWNMNANVAPMILPKDNAVNINATGTAELNVMYPDPASSLNFVTYSAFNVDNSGFGSDHSVLVTSQDFSGNNGSKLQSPYAPTQLRYMVKVEKAGNYTVDATGFFYPEREKNSDTGSFELIADVDGFDLNINAVAVEDENILASSSISFPVVDITNPENFVNEIPEVWDGNGGQTIDFSANGIITLPEGNYWIEVSTDYPYADTFNLSELTVTFAGTTAIDNIVSNENSVFYTKVAGGINLNVAVESSVSICDLSGKVIYSNKAFKGSRNIEINANGVYILKVSNSNETVTKKIIL